MSLIVHIVLKLFSDTKNCETCQSTTSFSSFRDMESRHSSEETCYSNRSFFVHFMMDSHDIVVSKHVPEVAPLCVFRDMGKQGTIVCERVTQIVPFCVFRDGQ